MAARTPEPPVASAELAQQAAANKPLTPKRQRFVEEYLTDMNASAAYQRAGYQAKGRSGSNAASRLLREPAVAQRIQQAMEKRSKELGIDARYVLIAIKATIERCSQAEPVMAYDKEVKAMVATGEYKFDAGAVLKGAELLGKHLKMFADKVDVHGKSSGPVESKADLTVEPDVAYLKMIGK
ncbi:MAG: terminase small subunit [Burkholderiales bacterium]